MTGTKGKVVAITGASSGIGEATARLLAEGGARVVLGARRTERLDAIAREIRDGGGAAVSCRTDVAQCAVVAASHVLGQLEKSYEHRRHRLRMFNAALFDQPEQTLGIELRQDLHVATQRDCEHHLQGHGD